MRSLKLLVKARISDVAKWEFSELKSVPQEQVGDLLHTTPDWLRFLR
jgi:hypothetical protein